MGKMYVIHTFEDEEQGAHIRIEKELGGDVGVEISRGKEGTTIRLPAKVWNQICGRPTSSDL